MKILKISLIIFFIPLLSFASRNNKEKFKLYYFEKDYKSFGVKDTIDPKNDTTIYYYSVDDINKIRKEIPNGVDIIHDMSNDLFRLSASYSYLVHVIGYKDANKYIYLFKKYGKKITEEEYLQILKNKADQRELQKEKEKKNNEIFKQRLATGEVFEFEKGSRVKYRYDKPKNIQPILESTLPDVEFFYLYNSKKSSHNEEAPSLILMYKGEGFNKFQMNKLFYLNSSNNEISFRNKVICIIILQENNYNTKVEILSVSDDSKTSDKYPVNIFNKKVVVKVNGKQETYYLQTKNKQILAITKLDQKGELYYYSKYAKFYK